MPRAARILPTMLQHAGRVVVTGGAGFIGSHLVDRLLAETRAEIVVLDNLHRGRLENLPRSEPRLHVVVGDIRDEALVDATLRGTDVLYHLAAQSTVMGAVNDPAYNFTSNVIGTFNVLSAATRHRIRRVLFASSREVYGEAVSLPVGETSPLLPVNSYGASKLAGEAYCRAFRRESGLATVILRLTNVYGPRDFGRVIPLWLGQADDGRDLTVYGGKQVMDFVWVGQVVDALVRAGSVEELLPPINVGSGTGTRILDLARRITLVANRQSRVSFQPARSVEVTRFIANVDRMRQMLGVEPLLDPLAHLSSARPALCTMES
jgi:UDP-glucose 4-epimerase